MTTAIIKGSYPRIVIAMERMVPFKTGAVLITNRLLNSFLKKKIHHQIPSRCVSRTHSREKNSNELHSKTQSATGFADRGQPLAAVPVAVWVRSTHLQDTADKPGRLVACLFRENLHSDVMINRARDQRNQVAGSEGGGSWPTALRSASVSWRAPSGRCSSKVRKCSKMWPANYRFIERCQHRRCGIVRPRLVSSFQCRCPISFSSVSFSLNIVRFRTTWSTLQKSPT